MASLWSRINTFLLLLLVLMAGATIAMLATRIEGGPLDPPGTPASTLPQVEPRSPIPPVGWDGTSAIVIDTPGSYFLTRDIVGAPNSAAISIESRNVALDLNGFGVSAQGFPLAPIGILVGPAADRGVEIRNGAIRNGIIGIDVDSAAAGVRISDVRVSNSGLGIRALGAGAVVEDCTVHGNGDHGIVVINGVVRRCSVFANARDGIRAQGGTIIEDNLVFNNGSVSPETLGNITASGQFNYVRDNVALTTVGGAPSFRITGTNNHFLRNYYRCGAVADTGGNFFPATIDLVDTNYC